MSLAAVARFFQAQKQPHHQVYTRAGFAALGFELSKIFVTHVSNAVAVAPPIAAPG